MLVLVCVWKTKEKFSLTGLEDTFELENSKFYRRSLYSFVLGFLDCIGMAPLPTTVYILSSIWFIQDYYRATIYSSSLLCRILSCSKFVCFICVFTVRRIHVSRLMKRPEGFSFRLLIKFTQEYLNLTPFVPVSFVYEDEDGDEITIETCQEFIEAWEHVGSSLFRVTGRKSSRLRLTFEGNNNSYNKENNLTSTFVEMQKLFEAILSLLTHWISTIQTPLVTSQPTMEESTQTSSVLNDENFLDSPKSIQVKADEVARRIVKGVQAVRTCSTKSSQQKPTLITLDPNFIHARHTCDQCGISPIVGYRYHALNKLDFDFCQNCFDSHDTSAAGVEFEPQQLSRDKQFQHRRRHLDLRRQHRQAWEGRERAQRPCTLKKCRPLKRRACNSVIGTQESKDNTKAAEEIKDIEKIIDTTIDSVNTFVSGIFTELAKEAVRVEKEVTQSTQENSNNKVKSDIVKENSKETLTCDTSKICVSNVFVELAKEAAGEEKDEGQSTHEGSNNKVTSDDGVNKMFKETLTCDTSIEDGMYEVLCKSESSKDEISMRRAECVSKPDVSYDEDLSNEVIVSLAEIEVETDMVYVSSSNSSAASNESWDVVDDNEAMARASSAIGSALFESEVGLSCDECSIDTDSSHSTKQSKKLADMSLISSMSMCSKDTSSTSKSSLSEAVLSRWKIELAKLVELGFDNEVHCVEALESLAAANIGCDRDEPVTIQQAVNYLLQNA